MTIQLKARSLNLHLVGNIMMFESHTENSDAMWAEPRFVDISVWEFYLIKYITIASGIIYFV